MSTRLITIGVICLVISNSPLSVGATGRAPGGIDKHIIDQRHQLSQALNQWDLEALAAARAGFERLLDRGGRDWLIRYYIALADYRIAIYHMQAKELEKMDPYLEEAEQQLEESIEQEPNFGESVALLAAILGLKITRKPVSGIWIGPKIGGIMAEATRLSPTNPRMWLIDGISAYYRPAMFGGGADAAKASLRNSIKFFSTESIDDPAFPSWGASESFAWLGAIEMNKGELDSARVHFEQALEINPLDGWVRFHLMPRLDELDNQQ
jgi:tetratricopeptide (TPR) repeat protein